MDITVLGASSGIGGPARTTSFRVGEAILIDCGTGVGDLPLPDLLAIDTVLLTHSHLDHSGLLPLLAHAHASNGGGGVTVYTGPETVQALKTHMFSGPLWPDYTRYPHPDRAFVRLCPVTPEERLQIHGLTVAALPACHSVPALGWLVDEGRVAWAFTGDSGPCPAFWKALARVPHLTDVLGEISYDDSRAETAARFGHLSPALLAPLLEGLPSSVRFWVSHLEPGDEARMMALVAPALGGGRDIRQLVAGSVIRPGGRV